MMYLINYIKEYFIFAQLFKKIVKYPIGNTVIYGK